MTLRIMTLSIMILSIMTLDMKTLRIVIKYDTEETIALSFRLSVAVMLSAIMLNVAVLIVVAPSFSLAANIRGIRVSVIICKTQHFYILKPKTFAL